MKWVFQLNRCFFCHYFRVPKLVCKGILCTILFLQAGDVNKAKYAEKFVLLCSSGLQRQKSKKSAEGDEDKDANQPSREKLEKQLSALLARAKAALKASRSRKPYTTPYLEQKKREVPFTIRQIRLQPPMTLRTDFSRFFCSSEGTSVPALQRMLTQDT